MTNSSTVSIINLSLPTAGTKKAHSGRAGLKWEGKNYVLQCQVVEVELDCFGSFVLGCINYFGVYLGSLHVGVSHHFADGAYVGAVGKLEGCIGVAETMEGDIALDTG